MLPLGIVIISKTILAEFGVKTIEDLGEVTVSEFRQIVPANIVSSEEIEALISFAKKQSEADE